MNAENSGKSYNLCMFKYVVSYNLNKYLLLIIRILQNIVIKYIFILQFMISQNKKGNSIYFFRLNCLHYSYKRKEYTMNNLNKNRKLQKDMLWVYTYLVN